MESLRRNAMKNVLKSKSLICVLVWIFILFMVVSCKPKADPEKITRDCEFLAKILREASVDVSQTIDEGLNLDAAIEEIKTEYKRNLKKYRRYIKLNDNGIEDSLFAYTIKEVLKDKLTRPNNHLSFSCATASYTPWDYTFVLFSDILFEKNGDTFVVYQSDDKHVKPGMVYDGDISQLYKTVQNGKVLYRFGVVETYRLKKTKISVAGKEFKVPVKYVDYHSDEKENLTYEIDGTTMTVKFSSCEWHTEAESNRLKDAAKAIGETITEKNIETIVFDLRRNNGGSTSVPWNVLLSLVYGVPSDEDEEEFNSFWYYEESNTVHINTLTTRNRTGMQGWGDDSLNKFLLTHADEKYVTGYQNENEESDDADKKEPVTQISPLFNGKVIVVEDNGTASSAELFIAFLKIIFKDRVLSVGQKTWGCLDYGNVYLYRLPDSKIAVLLSQSDSTKTPLLQNSGWQGDTKGFIPDYWFAFDGDFDVKTITGQIEW